VVGGIAITSYVTAMPLLHGAIGHVGALAQSLLSVLPFLVTFFTLWLMYTAIPSCAVPRRDAAVGALLGAILFELARWGFSMFVQHAQTYQQIYGVLAAIPIFLLWIYLSWVIVIFSASIAASLSAFDYAGATRRLPADAAFLGLLVVLRHFVDAQRRGRRVAAQDIRTAEPYLSGMLIDDCLDDLREAGLIEANEEGEWLLLHSLDSADLLRVYQYSSHRLPLRPLEAAAALGIELPAPLLDLLDGLAAILQTRLGARLEQVYPRPEDDAAATDTTEMKA
jgi:membrane protein